MSRCLLRKWMKVTQRGTAPVLQDSMRQRAWLIKVTKQSNEVVLLAIPKHMTQYQQQCPMSRCLLWKWMKVTQAGTALVLLDSMRQGAWLMKVTKTIQWSSTTCYTKTHDTIYLLYQNTWHNTNNNAPCLGACYESEWKWHKQVLLLCCRIVWDKEHGWWRWQKQSNEAVLLAIPKHMTQYQQQCPMSRCLLRKWMKVTQAGAAPVLQDSMRQRAWLMTVTKTIQWSSITSYIKTHDTISTTMPHVSVLVTKDNECDTSRYCSCAAG